MPRKLRFLAPLVLAAVALLVSRAVSAQQLYQIATSGALANVRADALLTIPQPAPAVFKVTVSGTLSAVNNQAGLFDSTVAPGASFTETFYSNTTLPATSNSLAGVEQNSTWTASGAGYGISGSVGDVVISSNAASSETVINTDSSGSPTVNSEQQTTNGVTLTGLTGAYSTDFAQVYLSDPSNTPSLIDPSADWGDSWANKSFFLNVNPASGVIGSLAMGTISSVTVTTTPNVSSSVSVTVVSVTSNPLTHVYTYKMNLTNTGGSAVAGPLQVVVGNIPSGVTLSNSSGTAPSGSPFVTVSSSSVGSGASVGFTLTFADPTKVATNGFTTQTYSGSL
jgi:hypothetical protein